MSLYLKIIWVFLLFVATLNAYDLNICYLDDRELTDGSCIMYALGEIRSHALLNINITKGIFYYFLIVIVRTDHL